jgi:hypothetical protein
MFLTKGPLVVKMSYASKCGRIGILAGGRFGAPSPTWQDIEMAVDI